MRLGKEISRLSLKPIPLCILNRRTFARLHSVKMLETPTDMSVPSDRFFWSDASNEGLHACRSMPPTH